MRSRHGLSTLALMTLALAPATSLAGLDGCKVTAERAGGVNAGGVEKVVIRAGAGDLKVVGRGNAVRIEARGVACAAKQALLDETQLSVRREGNIVYVETALPHDSVTGWTWGDNDYAYIDLGVALPANIPVETIDSSGDADFEDLGSLTLQDSSGDIEIKRVAGLVDVSDSSGDLEVDAVGSIKIRDSSGDIEVEDVRADVEIELDSSGDIHVSKVAGSVRVRQDSSGNIRAEEVKGGVAVDSDSSGDIYARQVGGDFTVSEDGSGSIGHESIGGRVNLPSHKRDEVE